MHGGTGRGPLEIRDPGEGWLRGHRGTGSMHGGTVGVSWRYGVPEGPVAHTGGWLRSPMGSPGRDSNGVPGVQAACWGGGGDPPRLRGPQGGTAMGRQGGRQGSWGGGQRGRARPEECGLPGSPGAAAARCASRPGPRRWVWESCRCALGQPPAAPPRARRRPHGPPWLTFKQDFFFFPILTTI